MSNRLRIIIVVFTMLFALITASPILCTALDEDVGVFEDEGISVQTMNQDSQPSSLSDLKSKSAILLDAGSGQVLFEKKCHERLPLASVTKVMSMLLFMEAIDSGRVKYSDKATCSEHAASMGGSQIWLEPGEQMTVEELMKCVAVASANDCTVALAEHIYGSHEGFVNLMNEKARQLGMKDTNFINATGLDADNHYSSAYDIALMSKELINKHPTVKRFTTIWMDTARNGEFGLANTNRLIRYYKGCDGIKTGSTSKALFCLSASAARNGLKLITVVMAAPTSKDRFAEASKLLDNGFANYSSVLVGKKEDVYGTIKVSKGTKTNMNCVVPEDMRVLVRKGAEGTVERLVSIEPKIQAPVKKGQKVGEITLKTKQKNLGKFDLVAPETIDKVNVGNLFKSMADSWFRIGR